MIYIETKNIVKQYAIHRALDDVSIRVSKGSVYGLLGPNGAGKTTLIRVINRIVAPDSGEVFFDGKASTPDVIYNMGYLPEERGLYKKMKIGEQAIFLAQLKGLSKPEAKARIFHWFEKFDILSWKDRRVEELSKGMQQKVQFIITVVHDPDLLILDEPFSGFDPLNADLIKTEILELKAQGKTIILSTHNMESVEALCDEISLLHQSKVLLQGSVPEIKTKYKQNIFELRLASTSVNIESDQFTVLSKEEVRGETSLLIQKQIDCTNSDLLKTIVNDYEVLAFEEKLPTMNEIFIQTVKQ